MFPTWKHTPKKCWTRVYFKVVNSTYVLFNLYSSSTPKSVVVGYIFKIRCCKRCKHYPVILYISVFKKDCAPHEQILLCNHLHSKTVTKQKEFWLRLSTIDITYNWQAITSTVKFWVLKCQAWQETTWKWQIGFNNVTGMNKTIL